MKRLRTSLALALTAAFALSACNDGSSANDTTAEQTAQPSAGAETNEPVAGGDLRFALVAAPTGVDPQQVGSNVSIYIARSIADSLTDQDPTTGEIVPWLAEKWETNEDLTEFTFTLKPGITFSDGSPLTAQIVKENFDSIVEDLGALAPLGSGYLSGYEGTTVTDELTFTVAFDAPNAQFLQATATQALAIVSSDTVKTSPEERLQGQVIGTGPFVVESYTQDQGAVLAKREGYDWASPAFEHSGDAYLDKITFTVVPESGVRTGGLVSGQFDAISDALPQDITQIEGAGGKVLTRSNPGLPFVLHLNVAREPLNDPAVRKALNPGINRQELVDTVLSDQFNPATSILAATTPGYADQSGLLAFDPDAAKKILEEAGWVTGGDGIREKDGKKLSFSVVYAQLFSGNQAVLELTQQQLRAIGVDLQLKQATPAEQAEILASGDYEAYYYNSTRAEGDVLRTSFHAGLRNIAQREADDALEPVLEASLAEADSAKRNELLGQAQELIIENAYAIPLFELSQSIGVAGNVHGLGFEASSRLKFYDTWIAEQ